MKKTKLYFKKSLAIFMAVMMLLSAWVFVAPEKASAASSMSYTVTLNFNLSNCAKGGHIVIYYYPVNADGTLDKSNTNLTYTFMNSLTQYSSGDNQTYTAGGSGDNRPSGDSSKTTGEVPGWPYKVYVKTNGSWGTNANIAIKSIKIGNKTVLSSTSQWSCSNTDRSFEAGGSYDGIATTWPEPALSAVRTTPTKNTVTVPKGGSGSQTFTVAYNDQYGVQWPSTSGTTASLSSSLNGTSVSVSGNTATVTATEKVFESLSNYSASTGTGSVKLNMTNNGITGSCDVTFQSPKYNVYLKDINGNTVKTYSQVGYYNQSVTLTDLPANTAAKNVNNVNGHQTYQWEPAATLSFNILADRTFNEEAVSNLAAHTYGAWSDGGANCARTCTVCGYSNTQAHNYKGVETQAPTCEDPGVKTYTCTECGNSYTETIHAKGHDFTSKVYAEKETGENGSHYQKCNDCGEYGWDNIKGDSRAHNWDKNGDGTVNAADAKETKASTCKDEGYELYVCQVCGAQWKKTLDKLTTHTAVKTEAKDVSNNCGAKGYAAFWTCSVCGKIWTDEALTTEIEKYEYTEVDGVKVPSELVADGPSHLFEGAYVNAESGEEGAHYRACKYCGKAYGIGTTEGATVAHNYVYEQTVAPTCETKGKGKHTCSDCNDYYIVDVNTVAHNKTYKEGIEATCEDPGVVEHYYCSICNKNYSDEACTNVLTTVVISASGHKWTEHHEEYDSLNTAATCQKAAVYNNHCDNCGEKLSGTHPYGDPDTVNGHKFDGEIKNNDDDTHSYKCTVAGCTEYGKVTECTYEVTEDVDSTCKTKGHTSYGCTTCNNGYSDIKELDEENHEGETEIRDNVDAKCNTEGYTGDTYCLGCDTKIADGQSIAFDKTNHEDMKKYDAKDSTCQEEGWKAYEYCSACQTYKTDKVTVVKKAHKFTSYVTNNNGTHTAICDTCAEGTEKATDVKDCTGGTANCEDKAVCTVCNVAYGEVDSANHKAVSTIARVEPTCQVKGKTSYRYCSACDTNVTEPKDIDMIAHAFGGWSKLEGEDKHVRSCTKCVDTETLDIATETADCSGGIAYCNELAKCDVCKTAYGAFDAGNHKTQAWHYADNKLDSTCQAEGNTGDKLYDCCGVLNEAGTTIVKKDHQFTIEVSRTDATCIAAGSVVYKCSTCVESEGVNAETNTVTLPIDSKNHVSDAEIVVGDYPASCTTSGFTGNVYHACCYVEGADNKTALIRRGEEIKANGRHKYISAAPEYMLDLDGEGNAVVVDNALKVLAEEPDYDTKVEARHADGKWYHAQLCQQCNQVIYEACYTYAHTYNCVETDICEVCAGLCSLTDADKHKDALTEVEGYAATCQAEGKKSYYECGYCEKTYLDEAGKKSFDFATEADKLVIAKSGHSFDWENPTSEVEATCGQAGSQTFTCTVVGCGATTERASGSATGAHTWETVVTDEPSCGDIGYKADVCTVCQTVKTNSYVTIPATGDHIFDDNEDGIVDRNDAVVTEGTSCTEPGTLTYTCKECGFEKVETDTEGVSAHQWGAWEKLGGDCATGVVMVRKCTVEGCDAKEQERRDTDAHEFELKAYVEPTAENDGYKLYECANCGEEKREDIPFVPSEGGEGGEGGETPDTPDTPENPDGEEEHLLKDDVYVTVEEATCSSPEIRRYTCIRCGATVEKEYGEPLEHVWIKQTAEIATCTRDGHSEYFMCVRINCGAEYGEGKVVYPAKGHFDGDGNGKCDDCNSAFYKDSDVTKVCSCLCHNDSFFMRIIYKIVCFFWKLFKINNGCSCGAVHY